MAKNLKQLKEEYTSLLEEMNSNLKTQLEVMATLDDRYNPGIGVVYILRQRGTKNYKIGFSANYKHRKNEFAVRLPFETEEVIVHRTEDYRKVEAELHKYFKNQRLNNSEFFELTDLQIEALPNIIKTIEKLLKTGEVAETLEPEDKDAELVEKTIELMKEHDLTPEEISSSLIQRKLAVGYARAARIKDRLLIK